VEQLPLLSLIVFTPLAGALVLLIPARERENLIRGVGLAVALLEVALCAYLVAAFRRGSGAMQFVEQAEWVPRWGIRYYLGVDGISLWLVVLTALLTALALLSSFSAVTQRVKEFWVLMLLLECAMQGVFLALDLFLFYVFWEAMLIPMYFIIGVWGGPRRLYAAIKFVLFTMFGSVLMLVAIIWLVLLHAKATGRMTFDLMALSRISIPWPAQAWLFLAFALAFAIKVPVFPFHTWLPDAHVEAPTAGSVILAGILLKIGTYGFLRFCLPLFPLATVTFVPLLCGLALVGIIYGGMVSAVQADVKRLVAYSSVSHLGFVTLGIFSLNLVAVQGALLQMINHGLSTGALFLAVGVLYERRHTRMISEYGGLAKEIPFFAALFLVVCLSSLGLPGTNGFVGEFLILLGAFKAKPLYAVLAALGVVLAAIYLLWMFRRVMYGPVSKPENKGLPDLNLREALTLLPIVVGIFWIGLYPNSLLSRSEASTRRLLAQVEAKQSLTLPAVETKAAQTILSPLQRPVVAEPGFAAQGKERGAPYPQPDPRLTPPQKPQGFVAPKPRGEPE